VDDFEQKLRAKYEVRELGKAKHFLGIRIVQDRSDRKLWLLQDSYIDKIAKKFHIKPTKIPKTPLLSTDLVKYEGKATNSQIQGYQQKVGTLNFPANITRPDITKASSQLCQFLQNPSPDHTAAVDQALEYTVGTKYRAIQFDSKVVLKQLFVTSSDSAFADDPATRYSSHGYAFSLFSRLID
jgi:hypothetical protein